MPLRTISTPLLGAVSGELINFLVIKIVSLNILNNNKINKIGTA